MKKLSLLRGSMILALAVGGLAGCAQQAQMARAEGEPAAVSALLLGAMNANKQYTKQSQIFLNTEAVADIETHFHAGVASLKRTTYYDENSGALLMGDFDGSFAHINSGYKNDGEGNANHFRYDGTAEPKEAELFTDITSDWKAAGQTVGGYYQTLTTLAAVAGSATWDSWTNGDGYTIYRHKITNLQVNDGAYNDAVLNAFQYFAAPLLLRDNYITYDSVWVMQADVSLSIRLYASKSDSGKSTVAPGDNEVLIAESRVFKGLSFSPLGNFYLKGDFNDWQETDKMIYGFDAYNPREQLYINKSVTAGQKFKLYDKSDDSWKGYSSIESGAEVWFNNDSGNIEAKADCTISIYWKPKDNVMWISVNTVKLSLTLPDWLGNDNAVPFAWVWGSANTADAWYAINDWTKGGTSGTLTIPGDSTGFKVLRCKPGTTIDNVNWDAKYYNESANINITAGTVSYTVSL